jgi:hypothetical protein
LNQILKRQTSRSHYGSKAPAVTITVFKNRNKIGKIVVKTVPYSMNVNVKNFFTSHIDKKKKKKKEKQNEILDMELSSKDTICPFTILSMLLYLIFIKAWRFRFRHHPSARSITMLFLSYDSV